MSTESNPRPGTGGEPAGDRAEEALDQALQDENDLAHGGDEAKAEEIEKKAYGDQDKDGEADTPYTQFPG
ncbi:hypothetical protein [Arthrobacter mobilis]|uniref:Uncharacterized protein n=1 Tax=Arthrobacter mobilis TaxID=2724944 RepID=A0A7X6K798_9MICC|nr:hypothetical protein [Arthrobacter mobilis]NKX56455.1 hypothetical protein [Arthrobacter mobilis]